MARPKSQSDAEVFSHVFALLQDLGEKGLTFGAVSKSCGLAPATLAQRFGSIDGMVRAALLAEWGRLCDAVTTAEAETLMSNKGSQALLKSLPQPSAQVFAMSMRDPELQSAAQDWRARVETAIAARRGGGAKGRESAAMIFAAWYGRQIWEPASGKSFRLSDLLKALS
jgi:AcrR family transcriptional regulator